MKLNNKELEYLLTIIMSKEHQLREIICEAMCEIESDFDDELTVGDIYKILAKYNDIDEIPLDVILDDEINYGE